MKPFSLELTVTGDTAAVNWIRKRASVVQAEKGGE